MQKITINKIYRNTEKKDGTPYLTNKGKPYTKVVIKGTDENGQAIDASKLDFKGETGGLQEGTTVNLEITKNGQYTNFDLPNDTKDTLDKIETSEEAGKLDRVLMGIGIINKKLDRILKDREDGDLRIVQASALPLKIEAGNLADCNTNAPAATPPPSDEDFMNDTVDQLPF